MQAKPCPTTRQEANKSTQTPKVFRSDCGTTKNGDSWVYVEEPTSALLDHDSDIHQATQELFYTPTSSDIDASPNNSTQTTPALPMTSSQSTQTDAPPATSNESVQTVPEDPAVARYDLINRSTLQEAFAAAFTVPLDHDVAQIKFTEAAADYYLTNATELYDDFRMQLRANLAKNAIHRTSSFCQVFLSVSGYLHVFTESRIGGMITREFADATVGSKQPHRKFVELVLPANRRPAFHCNGFVTLFNDLLSISGAVIRQEEIQRWCGAENSELLQKIDMKRLDMAQMNPSRNTRRLEEGLARHTRINKAEEASRLSFSKFLAEMAALHA